MSHGPLLTQNDRSILAHAPGDHGHVYLTGSRHYNPSTQVMEVRYAVTHVTVANLEDLEHPSERVVHMDTRLIGAMYVFNACVESEHRLETGS